jgi:hypothetical protein
MLRFTIRDLLWLTLVVAVLCAWGVDHMHLKQSMAGIVQLYEAAATRLNALNAPTTHEWEVPITKPPR